MAGLKNLFFVLYFYCLFLKTMLKCQQQKENRVVGIARSAARRVRRSNGLIAVYALPAHGNSVR
jgi:hypothetical protein